MGNKGPVHTSMRRGSKAWSREGARRGRSEATAERGSDGDDDEDEKAMVGSAAAAAAAERRSSAISGLVTSILIFQVPLLVSVLTNLRCHHLHAPEFRQHLTPVPSLHSPRHRYVSLLLLLRHRRRLRHTRVSFPNRLPYASWIICGRWLGA